ncbi:transmembrane protein [Thalictrum thalictroides]|uniref:Transmembrane protein n=1 Tax=Thalictrum thalictroides TaxID=46969 RepID=A0A7J6XDK8_THATH|nr:transmembrane protein [Thalictrum thalictroides]
MQSVQSMVIIRFDKTPLARTNSSTAIFRYSVLRPDGSNACKKKHNCSIHCQLDGKTLKLCSLGSTMLQNLTVNHDHHFVINVTTPDGEKNSSSYKWFIDTIPPTASITTERMYTNAENAILTITFSEPCTGQGGFKCINASTCDIIISGSAKVDTSTLRLVKPGRKYSIMVAFSSQLDYGLVAIKMKDNFCTDQAGNRFLNTNGSAIIVHFDRRPVKVDIWTSVPSYELQINKVPRTVLATNKMEDLEIYLDFSDPVVNSTKEITSALHVNAGHLQPIHSQTHGNRRFVFKLRNVSRINIITVKFQSASIIGRSGTPVSYITPIAFMYDSTKPDVKLRTNSPGVTKESNINVIVEFTKPVFGFQTSGLNVKGGRITRFRELSKSRYSLTVLGTAHKVISVLVPEGKVKDVAGNQNLASNRIEVRQYSPPAISVALHSFVTAGLLATSLAAAVLSLSSTNLGAVGAITSGTTDVVVSNPSMNLLGMVGHLQVFVFSEWILMNQPIEYSETTNGLRWLIPREKLPWKKENVANHDFPGRHNKLSMKPRTLSVGFFDKKGGDHTMELNSNSSSHLQNFQSPIELAPEVGRPNGQQNISMRSTSYGELLQSYEYSIYFLREEPFSALVKKESYTGWKDFEMNMFWLGVASGSLLLIHLLILLFLRWRTGSLFHGNLSVPRFELFLLIFMIPCISQASAFVIKGGTTKGIIAGILLLAIPATFVLSVCLLFVMALFIGGHVQYKEIMQTGKPTPCHTKLQGLFFGRPTKGKWFYQEGLTSYFLLRFGFLFEDRKGPPVLVLTDQNDPNRIPKWIDSGQSGIGRMRPVDFDNGNEITQISMSKKLLGCARSAYLILDLLRRVAFGIMSGAYSTPTKSQSIIALAFTLGQLLYLLTLKPYIRRGVHVVESVSLLCEAAMFGLSLSIANKNPFKEQTLGFVMISLLFITFLSQLVNEWYALVRWLLSLPQSSNPSFKLGLKFVFKGLILPFLPRKYWLKLVPESSHPSTGLIPVPPLSPETPLVRRNETKQHVDPLNSMTATVFPVRSPGIHGFWEIGQTSGAQGAREAKQQKGIRLEPKSEVSKLRELAKASFNYR